MIDYQLEGGRVAKWWCGLFEQSWAWPFVVEVAIRRLSNVNPVYKFLISFQNLHPPTNQAFKLP